MNEWDGYTERRKSSESSEDELIILVRQIHQRQNEITIPKLEKLERRVYGNGELGLCERITRAELRIEELAESIKCIPKVIGWVVGGTAVCFGALEFIFKWHSLFSK